MPELEWTQEVLRANSNITLAQWNWSSGSVLDCKPLVSVQSQHNYQHSLPHRLAAETTYSMDNGVISAVSHDWGADWLVIVCVKYCVWCDRMYGGVSWRYVNLACSNVKQHIDKRHQYGTFIIVRHSNTLSSLSLMFLITHAYITLKGPRENTSTQRHSCVSHYNGLIYHYIISLWHLTVEWDKVEWSLHTYCHFVSHWHYQCPFRATQGHSSCHMSCCFMTPCETCHSNDHSALILVLNKPKVFGNCLNCLVEPLQSNKN